MFDSDIIHNSENRRRRYVNDILLLAACLLAGCIAAAVIRASASAGGYVEVRVEHPGSEAETTVYPLSADRDVTIRQGDDINVVHIAGGQASMSEANCPDLICVRTRAVSHVGESVICLPHGVIVTVIGDDTKVDDTGEYDAVTW